MNRVPIVSISDNKLAFAVATLFVNLLETKFSDTFYELKVLVTPDFSDANIKLIKQIEQDYPNGCSVEIKQMDNRFDNIKNGTGYIANACAYKFCIPEMFPQYNKVIYLDTDIVVFKDLKELYDIEINDNYFAGVFSVQKYLDCQNLAEKLQINDLLYYVNAGVLVFNLDKIRQDDISKKCIELIGSYDDSVDQHIFNKVCYPKIKLIPPKYNVTKTNYKFYENNDANIQHTDKEIQETKNPIIYHYTGRSKPWNTVNIRYGAVWLRYFKKTGFPNNIKLEVECNSKAEEKFYRIFGCKIRKQLLKKFFEEVLFKD